MYRLFYDYETNGDVLFVVIDPEKKVTKTVSNGNVTAIYSGEELVGINLFEISSSVKIKSHGIIFAPSEKLLSAINPVLLNAGLPALEEPKSSGYRVLRIKKLEEHPLDEKAQIVTLSDGKEDYTTVSWYSNLREGMQVVSAMDGCILIDGTLFHKGMLKNIAHDVSLCGANELKIESPSKGAFIPEGYQDGEDFFYATHE